MAKLNLINVKQALASLTARDATKADLSSLEKQVSSIGSDVNDIKVAMDSINKAINKKL